MNVARWAPSDLHERGESLLRQKIVRIEWTMGPLALLFAPLGLVALVGALFPFFFGRGRIEVLLAAFALISGFTAVIVGLNRHRRRLHAALGESDGGLREPFDRHEGWFVELLVHQGAAVTGTDRGMLWIEDGGLLFSGYRTSFALGSDDVSAPPRYMGALPSIQGALRLPLKARTPAGELALSFNPLPEEELLLLGRIGSWIQDAPLRKGQLPPITLGPGALPRNRLLRCTWVATAYWALAAGSIGLLMLAMRSLAAGLPVLLLALIVGAPLRAWHVVAWWRAWRDLGRVER
jgi:hypothetical protein